MHQLEYSLANGSIRTVPRVNLPFKTVKRTLLWFFPALGSLAASPNVVLSYIGQETRNNEIVQHIQSYVYQPIHHPEFNPLQQLSTMDLYLDATTFLPVALLQRASGQRQHGQSADGS